jgi:hypothetical protein
LAASCVAAVIAGCGGGRDTGASEPGQLEITPASAGDQTIGSGGLQQRVVMLRNGSSTDARNLRVRVALDAHVLQLPLSCDTATPTPCRVGADGALEIDQLPAGASIALRQQLRVKAGYSGPVSNGWTASSADASLSAQWQQTLSSRVADVGVNLQSVTVTGSGAARTLSYAITLSNAGPDEARDVLWTQTPGIDMPWQGASCSASGGAVCPANLSESIQIAQLPKGGSISLVLNYGGRTGAATPDTELLFSEVRAAGDPNAANDRLLVRQANAPGYSGLDGIYDLFDFEGHAWRMAMNYQPGGSRTLRFTSTGQDLVAAYAVDATGFGSIVLAGDTASHWYRGGTLNFGGDFGKALGLVAGSFDFGRGLQPFLVARDWVTDMTELAGTNYTIMGSRVDGAGNALDAYAWAARFAGSTLLICESDTPVSLDACPAGQVHSYDVAVVGSELELMSSDEVLHLRAVRTGSGPVLLRSERAADDSGATFWLGVQQTPSPAIPYPLNGGTAPATFASASGLALPASFEFSVDSQGQVQFAGALMPEVYFLAVQSGGAAASEFCWMQGTAQATALAGLYQGNLVGSSSVGSCYQGALYFAQTADVAVLLGRKEGPLSGRWMVVTD